MYERYPLSVTEFCKWIDEYKKRVNWNAMFMNLPSVKGEASYIKFHDIPLEMQFGIWMRFVVESNGHGDESRLEHAMFEVKDYLHYREIFLKK